jgi:hypothetical protein
MSGTSTAAARAALVPRAVLAVLVLLAATPAHAYVGPGAGVSLVGSVLGLLAAIGTAIGFILLWPIRAFLRRRKAKAAGDAPPAGGAPGGPAAPQP